jgi:hypothetical protein
MKQASFYLALLLLALLTTTTAAHAQLMRKDTASLPRSKWEVGLDLKPIWDQREPYNFVVRYFFKDRWVLRGGVGLEMNESKDTFRIFSWKLMSGAGLDSLYPRYGLNQIQKTRTLSTQAFVGIQREWNNKRLSLYSAIDLFFKSHSEQYGLPVSEVNQLSSEAPAVISDFTRLSVVDKSTLGGGIRLINGFRYYLFSDFSVSAEMALTAQRLEYEDYLIVRDESMLGDRTLKQTTVKGRNFTLEMQPLFRVFINYHFFKKSKS